MNDQFNLSFQYVQPQSCISIIKDDLVPHSCFFSMHHNKYICSTCLTEREEPPEMFRLPISLKHQQYLYDRVKKKYRLF